MSTFKDLSGQHYSDWDVVSFYGLNARKHAMFLCRCTKCGQEKVVVGSSLLNGSSRQCRSCATKLSRTNDYSGDPIKTVFMGMKQRCYNQNHRSYPKYGGVGITICDEWLSNPLSFYKWAYDNGYSHGLSIERIDVGMPYSPDNCKFIPLSEQAKNRTMSIMITIDGETKCLADWCKQYGMNPGTVKHRHHKQHMNWKEALTKPTR